MRRARHRGVVAPRRWQPAQQSGRFSLRSLLPLSRALRRHVGNHLAGVLALPVGRTAMLELPATAGAIEPVILAQLDRVQAVLASEGLNRECLGHFVLLSFVWPSCHDSKVSTGACLSRFPVQILWKS